MTTTDTELAPAHVFESRMAALLAEATRPRIADLRAIRPSVGSWRDHGVERP